jgi:hypothetical protein
MEEKEFKNDDLLQDIRKEIEQSLDHVNDDSKEVTVIKTVEVFETNEEVSK